MVFWIDQTETLFGPYFSHFPDDRFVVRCLICPNILKRGDLLLDQSSDVERVFDGKPENVPMIRLKDEVPEVEDSSR
jgi:hypothetical protein